MPIEKLLDYVEFHIGIILLNCQRRDYGVIFFTGSNLMLPEQLTRIPLVTYSAVNLC